MSVDLPASTCPSTTRCSCGLVPRSPAASAAPAAAHSRAKSGSSAYSAAGLLRCGAGAAASAPGPARDPGPDPGRNPAASAPRSPAPCAAGAAAGLARAAGGSLTRSACMPAVAGRAAFELRGCWAPPPRRAASTRSSGEGVSNANAATPSAGGTAGATG